MRCLIPLIACLVASSATFAAPTVLWRSPSGGYADKPTFADLNGDGRLEVVLATQPGNVLALAGVNGAELWRLETRTEQFLGTPLIADVDGDQDTEILVAGSRAGSLYCLNAADGQIQWEQPGEGEGISGSPCLAKLGDDGPSLLLVVADKVVCRDAASGVERWSYPLEDRSDGSVSVGDVGGGPEIFVGTNGGRLVCLAADGTLRWEARLGGRLVKPSIIADADGDGRSEVYAAGSTGIFRVDPPGTVKWKWAPPSGRGIASSAAMADVDGNGSQDLVATGYDGGLYALSPAGKLLWRFAIVPAGSRFIPASTPALVDLNGDGGADALVTSPNSSEPRFYAVNGKTGAKLWEVTTATYSQSCPAIADLDADGRLEALVCVPQGPEAQLTAYALNVRRDRGWFKYGGDLGSTGSLTAALHDAAYLAASRSPFEIVRSHPQWEDELPARPGGDPTPPPDPGPAPVPGRPASDIAVQLDGRWLNLNPPPALVENRTLVPLRGIFEALGAAVKWDNATKTVTAVRPESAERVETTVRLTIGDTLATINGAPVRLDVAGQLLNNSTYVPLRFIGEAFGATVQWDPQGRNVLITQ